MTRHSFDQHASTFGAGNAVAVDEAPMDTDGRERPVLVNTDDRTLLVAPPGNAQRTGVVEP